jgi:hypothetical protein
MKKILVTGKTFEGAVVVVYGEAGIGVNAERGLLSVDMSGAVLMDNQKAYLLGCVPVRYGEGYEQNWGVMTGKVMIVTEDHEPDFMDDFWWSYGKPVHKARAIKDRKALSRADKGMAVGRLSAYLRYLARTGVAKAQANNYLSKRYFDTDWDNA